VEGRRSKLVAPYLINGTAMGEYKLIGDQAVIGRELLGNVL